MSRNLVLPCVTSLAVAAFAAGATASDCATRLVTVPKTGTTASAPSQTPSASSDGRYVAFDSFAANLVLGDSNAQRDVFVRDRELGVTTLVSVDGAGLGSNGASSFARISADGRFVAFESVANDLVGGDTNNARDVFVRDLQLGVTTRVSVRTGGVEGNDNSFAPAISADGRYVVFESDARNLDGADTNNAPDVFLRDLQAQTTVRLSLGVGGVESDGASRRPAISGDGAFVAFDSSASNLANGPSAANDVYLVEVATGAIVRLSRGLGGAAADNPSFRPSLSQDGRFVAFDSEATNLVAVPGLAGFPQVYLYDRNVDAVELISAIPTTPLTPANADARSAVVSASGDKIAFWSVATNLEPLDLNNNSDVFVYDRPTRRTSLASVGPGNVGSDANSLYPGLSADGETVVWQSFATNLVFGGDGNAFDDVYARDCAFADPSSFCSGDGTGGACPCANPGAPGHGCAHSVDADGAQISWHGTPSIAADTVTLVATELPGTTVTLFFQGTQQQNGGVGAVFGDGLRCVSGTIKRLGAVASVGGVAAVGAGATTPTTIHTQGVVPAAGGVRFYQAWYRNSATFCTAATFNLSNAVRIEWLP